MSTTTAIQPTDHMIEHDIQWGALRAVMTAAAARYLRSEREQLEMIESVVSSPIGIYRQMLNAKTKENGSMAFFNALDAAQLPGPDPVAHANAYVEKILEGMHNSATVARDTFPVGAEWRRFLEKFAKAVWQASTDVVSGALHPAAAYNLDEFVAEAMCDLGVRHDLFEQYAEPFILDAEGRLMRPDKEWVDDFVARLDDEILLQCRLIARFTPRHRGTVVSATIRETIVEAQAKLDKHTAKRRELLAYREARWPEADEQPLGLEDVPDEPAVWVGVVTKDYTGPGGTPLLKAGDYVLLTSNEPDWMYDQYNTRWNAYSTSWEAAEIGYHELHWPWLEGMSMADIVSYYP